jgi:queuine/archaeosine tRNA-ribosyltransferase
LKIVKLYKKLKAIFPYAEVRATVPDYCDDYNPKNLWVSEEYTNIERTIQNIIKAEEKHPDVEWLIPIQGWYKQPESVKRSIRLLKENDLLNYDYYAIGNLCTEHDTSIVVGTVKIVRKTLVDKKVHLFGLKLKHVPTVQAFIDSFDSMAWTRPINKSLKTLRDGKYVGWSCKSLEERKRYFQIWLNELNYLLSQTNFNPKITPSFIESWVKPTIMKNSVCV